MNAILATGLQRTDAGGGKIARMHCLLLILALVVLAARAHPGEEFTLSQVGRLETGFHDMSASEVAAYHPGSKRLFVVNGAEGLDIIDLADPSTPTRTAVRRQLNPTSVAVHGDLVAMSATGKSHASRGIVRFFDPDGRDLGGVEVGFWPDMLAFTPDGRTLLVACEGECPEPARMDDGASTVDPPGSVSLVDLSRGVGEAKVIDLAFDAFESQRSALIERGLRVVAPGRTLAEDLEPEFIAVSPDGSLAFVTLQENNAIAVIDIPRRTVRSIEPLGFRDCMKPGMGIDPTVDGVIAPRPVPVLAMYQPDAIAAFEHEGALWLLTANEGEARTGSIDEAIAWREATSTNSATEGRSPPPREPAPWSALQVSCVPAPTSFGGAPCAFGARSVSLWRVDPASGRITQAWDSGEAIERLVAAHAAVRTEPGRSKRPRVDARSTAKGPEPEGIALRTIAGRRLAAITLERANAVVLLDLTEPAQPRFVGFRGERDERVEPGDDADRDGGRDRGAAAGDLGPEGACFIPAALSPTGEDLLVVCNEVSGTTTILRVRRR